MEVPQGRFKLLRQPHRADSPLRAWDAADEYLLQHIAEVGTGGTTWLSVNDSFGALAVALAEHRPAMWSDSLLAHQGAEQNLRRNGLPADAVALLPSTDDPVGPVDVAVIKVPRSNALLEDQLRRLRPLLSPASIVVGGGMTKHMPGSAIELFERLLGPTATSLARKKARLIHPTFDGERDVGPSPFPTSFRSDGGITLVNHANVFSRDRLDNGSRLLLANLPELGPDSQVVDLGCGNGVLGVALQRSDPSARVLFTDVSYMAVASAAATHAANDAPGDATFRVADGLADVEPGSLDAVVSNPPFHENQAIGDAVAWQMFTEAKAALRPGGEIRIVGNRHLGYHVKLKRIFGNCDAVASTTKFVVLSARR